MLSSRQTLTLCAGLLLATGCVHDAKRATAGRAQTYAYNTNDPMPIERQDREIRAALSNPAMGGCQSAVYFDSDSARLDQGSRNRLDTVAECMKRREVDHATIVGQTDPSGSAQHNQDLGLERARAVAEYLRGRGVPTIRSALLEARLRLRSPRSVAYRATPARGRLRRRTYS